MAQLIAPSACERLYSFRITPPRVRIEWDDPFSRFCLALANYERATDHLAISTAHLLDFAPRIVVLSASRAAQATFSHSERVAALFSSFTFSL